MREAEYKFSDAQVEEGRIELVTRNGGDQAVELIAYVNGIEIGRSVSITPSANGRAAIMCSRFPHVNLPVILRFALGETGVDAAPPLTITSASEVARLVGAGSVVNTSLRIADGVLRGTAYNAVNGVGQPVLIGRINGLLMRPVQCEAMALRDEGGGRFTYHMRLHPEDLQASGAVFEIISLPGFETIASISYGRNDSVGTAAALSSVEAAVAMLGKRLDLEIARSGHAIDLLRKEILFKDDALIEYVTSMALDAIPEGGDRKGKSSNPPEFIWGKTKAARILLIPPASRWFVSGWNSDVTEYHGIPCRLVQGCGVLLNPHGDRNLARIEFSVFSGAKAIPAIDVLFDSKAVPVSVVSSDGHGPFSVIAELESPAAVALVRLLINDNTVDETPCPIANIRFVYDAEDAAVAPA